MTHPDDHRARRIATATALIAAFAVIIVRLFYLQVIHAAELTVKADRQHEKTVTVEGPRGTMYDRRGTVLAVNMDVPSVFGVPSSVDNPAQMARSLAPILHMRTDDIERKLKQERSFVWIARKLDPEQGRRLESLHLEGIGVVLEGRRFYPKGTMLSHVMGFAGMDGQGLEGLEQRYDRYLSGEKQSLVLERDALGRTIFPKGIGERIPAAGHNLVLTIDEFIQYVTEKELDDAVTATRAKAGMAIVMDPKTCEILAMAATPKFDPNAMHGMSADRWRNRLVTDSYEPGSTMKVFLAAAALEERVMTPDTLVYGENGRMEIAHTVIHDHEKSGWMTFADVIQRSSNIGAAKIAMRLEADPLFRYVKGFGFGEKSGVDLPGEAAGLVKEPRDWGRRSLASMAIGQEIGVTPLQLVTAISAIANGGWLMQPYIVSEVRTSDGTTVLRTAPQVRRRPISTHTAEVLTGVLEGVVTHGTGTRGATPGYRVAGKTGTAQKIDPHTGAYSRHLLVGSFAGFVPADDPRLAIVVVIDEPKTEAWGGVVAAPVFRRIAEQVLPYLGVAPEEPVKLTRAVPPSTGKG
jgi:cell division protein FtsI (penicillin-binding protein 3)